VPGAAALAGPVIVGIAIWIGDGPVIQTQTPAVSPPEFDAASIKPVASSGRCGVGGTLERLRFTPGRVASDGQLGITALGLILKAYHLAEQQLSGGPGWLETDRSPWKQEPIFPPTTIS